MKSKAAELQWLYKLPFRGAVLSATLLSFLSHKIPVFWYLPKIPFACFFYLRLAQARSGTRCHAAQGAQGKQSYPQQFSTFLSYCNSDPGMP